MLTRFGGDAGRDVRLFERTGPAVAVAKARMGEGGFRVAPRLTVEGAGRGAFLARALDRDPRGGLLR